jgi:tungstate transport system substrate-binding protein
MYNDFLIVGPAGDPAGVKGGTAANALRRILNRELAFISRGDDSGTHKKELALWAEAGGYHNLGTWYIETGTGMGKTLLVASEKEAYTLVDRATYMSMEESVSLEIMVEGDELLKNQYGIIAINPEKNPNVNGAGAQKLVEWIMSGEGQQMIADFTTGGEQPFMPLYGECLSD